MKSKPETFLLRVEKGRLVPEDAGTVERMREKGYHFGDVLTATLKKARNPEFHRLAHVFGKIVADNVDRFHGMGAHTVLKHLQYEGNIGCERMEVMLKGFGMVEVRIPKSLAFDSLDDGEFKEIFARMCKHVADNYWPGLTEDQVRELAEVYVEAA